jgi:NAD(P)-dependent dehydrogenase (short-subunit alcohol dehydrogenase family)
MQFQFNDQVVLITGASAGIGHQTALQFAKAGAMLMLADIDVTKGEKLTQELQTQGHKASFVRVDVSQAHEVENMVKKTIEIFGKLNIAVNNAGIGGSIVPTAEYNLEEYQKIIAVNQNSVFYGMHFQLKAMLAQGGKGNIINVASLAGMRPIKGNSPYTASKHAVIGMTKATALEYARTQIRINAVCPVYIRTQMVENIFIEKPDFEQKLLQSIPMKRFGTPEDVANQILWLCSDACSFITGQAITIDGGTNAT